MPEHLDARTTVSRTDMFYCISADQNFQVKKTKHKNRPTNHKISEERTLTNFFLLGLMDNDCSFMA